MTDHRYFFNDGILPSDPISRERPRKLRYLAGGQWKESRTAKYMPCYNPSTGAVIALAPAVHRRRGGGGHPGRGRGLPGLGATPPPATRVQVLFRMKALMDQHLDELTHLCAEENGKSWDEAMGDILKVTEVVEFACGIPHLMKGAFPDELHPGLDTTRSRSPWGYSPASPPGTSRP